MLDGVRARDSADNRHASTRRALALVAQLWRRNRLSHRVRDQALRRSAHIASRAAQCDQVSAVESRAQAEEGRAERWTRRVLQRSAARPLDAHLIEPGSGAIKAVRSDAYAKLANAGSVPKLPTDDDEAARTLLHTLLPTAHFLRVDRGGAMGPAQTGGAAAPTPSGPVKPADQVRIVSIAQQQMFAPDGYYVWLYNGPQWGVYLGGIGLVAVVLAGVMFPLWPPFMRLGTWYLSIAVLFLIGLFFGLAIFRSVGGHHRRARLTTAGSSST